MGTYRIAFGPRAGQKVLTVQGVMPREPDFKQNLCADMQGFSLHAAVRCDADDREALEQLCRYTTRPALRRAGPSWRPSGLANKEDRLFRREFFAFGEYDQCTTPE